MSSSSDMFCSAEECDWTSAISNDTFFSEDESEESPWIVTVPGLISSLPVAGDCERSLSNFCPCSIFFSVTALPLFCDVTLGLRADPLMSSKLKLCCLSMVGTSGRTLLFRGSCENFLLGCCLASSFSFCLAISHLFAHWRSWTLMECALNSLPQI